MSEIYPELSGLGAAIAKLDEETNDAYQAFLYFAALTGKERNIQTVAAKLGYSKEGVGIWQRQHRWLDRVNQVDAQRWLREQKERERLNSDANKKFAQANREIKQQSISIAKKMLNTADKLLQSADMAGEIVETGHVETKDGRRVATVTEIHMKAKISDIPRLVDTAVKVSRLAADLPTEIIRPDIPHSEDLNKLSLEELMALREDNRDILLKAGVDYKLGDGSDAIN